MHSYMDIGAIDERKKDVTFDTADESLPDPVAFSEYAADPPALPAELIKGVLRCGHKMLVSGPSKAGKSFVLLELAVCIVEALIWLGFSCRQGKVFYINFEIDTASTVWRLISIYDKLGVPATHAGDLVLWNLRGHHLPLEDLADQVLAHLQGERYAAVILDPIYKVMDGDENLASEVSKFCRALDRICAESGAALIYAHHHTKGPAGSKKAIDRSSGSGVFGRDPDAILDMAELVLESPEQRAIQERDGATAFRVQTTLREFPATKPVEVWFSAPLHVVDTEGLLKTALEEGTPAPKKGKSKA